MNQTWFYYLNNLASQKIWFDGLVVFFGEYFSWIVLAGLGAYLLFRQEKRILRMVIFSLILGTASLAAAMFIRFFYFHPRPFAFLGNIYQLIVHAPTASFPSAHAAFFFGLAAGIYFFNKRLSVAFFASAFLISVSRVIGGIHWPFDIIGGAIVGLASTFLLRYLWHRYKNRLKGFDNGNKEKEETVS